MSESRIDMLIALIIVVFLLLFLVKYVIKWRRLPPGPIGLPFIGYYPFLGKIPAETIAELSKKYGDVMSIHILGDDYWFLNSSEAIEEAFVKNGDLFAGRAFQEQFSLISYISPHGLSAKEGDEWKLHHRFTIGALASLGMGKSKFEYRIHKLLDRVEEYIDSQEGKANDYYDILTNFAANIITVFALNKEYDFNDSQYKRIRDWTHNLFASFAYMNFLLSGFGFKLLMTLKPKCMKIIDKNRDELCVYVTSSIEERLRTFDPKCCNDLLDYFLKEKDGPNGNHFQLEAITDSLIEFIFGGIETTSVTLHHGLRLMALNPKIQENVYKEICNIYGTEGVISYADRYRLPYTQAVISEVQRFVCLVALITTHVNREATKLFGYEVPKRQKFIANFYAISRSPKYFKNPNEFDPQNFLDTNGAYLPNKAFIPFSTGIRKCFGATLAKVDLFLAFTRLLQRFKWRVSGEHSEQTDVNEGLIRQLSENAICAIRRK